MSGVCVHKNILVETHEFECASVFLTVSLGVSARHVYTVCLCMCVCVIGCVQKCVGEVDEDILPK